MSALFLKTSISAGRGRGARQSLKMVALIFGFWTIFVLIDGFLEYLSEWNDRAPGGNSISFGAAIMDQVPVWYPVALLTPIVLWLGNRFRIERPRWAIAVLAHSILGLAFAI